MKYYVFFTAGINELGGIQAYVAGKARFLEQSGWTVFAFFYGKAINVPIKSLEKYKNGGLLHGMPWNVSRIEKYLVIRSILNTIGKIRKEDEIIIESHDCNTAPWGELVAKRLNAKHITALLSERYTGPDRCYIDKLDFYRFKLERKELPFNPQRAKLLFGDESFAQKYETRLFRIDEDPVQDVDSPLIDSIPHNDWNIGYIGRAEKDYLPNIIDGVCEFAKNHPDHIIQFIIIGDFSCRREYYNEKSNGIDNLKLIELGNQFPLPRCYFDKVDVVIAGSGSARCSVYEGKLTLIADANNFLCNGLLGYDTKNSIRADADTVQMSFAEGLERALVLKTYKDMTFDYPQKPGVAECVKQNFEFIATSDQSKRYYSEKELCKGKKKKIGIKAFIKLFLDCYFPKTYKRIMQKRQRKREKEANK